MDKQKRVKLIKLLMVLISVALCLFAMYLIGEFAYLADEVPLSGKETDKYLYLWLSLFLPVAPIIIFLVDISGFFPGIKNEKLTKFLAIIKYLIMFTVTLVCLYININCLISIKEDKKIVAEKTQFVYTSLEAVDRLLGNESSDYEIVYFKRDDCICCIDFEESFLEYLSAENLRIWC